MTRFLIFLFPALVDMLLGGTFFVASVRIAESGASAMAVTAVTAVWALAYIFSAQIAGRIVNPANCAFLLIGGCGVMACCSLAFIFFPSLNATYPIIMLLSIGTAFFFVPFQVFMKAVDKGDSDALPRSVGLYTFSWSSGMAAGPFVTAFLWNYLSWQACYIFCSVLSVITAVGVVFLKHHAHSEHSSSLPLKETSVDYSSLPDLAWIGWICSGVGCLTITVLRSYLPASATVMGISRADQGILLALISASQAFTGLLLCRSRIWMYKVLPIILFGVCGVAGLLIYGLTDNFLLLIIASILYGFYSGSFFFYFVFHSLVHPEHSTRNVGINESVVGVSAILGPLMAGVLGDSVSISSPYLASALLIVLALAFQSIVIPKIPLQATGALTHE